MRPRRKRARPSAATASPNHKTVPKATLITSLLWLVAFTTTHPSTVKAFVLATDRPSAGPSSSTLNKQPTPASAPLLASALADVGMDTSKMDDLFSVEERPEEVLDLAHMHLPLLSGPTTKTGGGVQASLAKIPDEEEVLEWAGRYTSVEALREHFGTNHNKVWGDLQASTARRLYKTLLPRALLELSKLDKVQPQHLAPLAYQARLAAKLYARERCTVPARIAATLFDGFRQWIKYGKFQAHGMTYDQLWEKYAEKILLETEDDHHFLNRPGAIMEEAPLFHGGEEEEECDPFFSDCEDLSEQVCLKILERACASNEGVDALTLKGKDWADDTELEPHQRALLEHIRSQLEEDMYQLVLPPDHHRPHDEEDKVELPELHGRARTRDRLKRGKFRLIKGGLKRQRRFWKLQQARKKHAEGEKPWKKSRSQPWLSRSRKHDRGSEHTDVTSDEDGIEWKP